MQLPRTTRKSLELLLTVAVLALLFSAMYHPYWFAALGIVLAALLYLPLSRSGTAKATSAVAAGASDNQSALAGRRVRLGGILLVLVLVALDLSMQVVGCWVVTYGDERPGVEGGTIAHRSLKLWGHEIGFVEADLWPGGQVRKGGCLLVKAEGQLRYASEDGVPFVILGRPAGRSAGTPLWFDWDLGFGRPMEAAGWSGTEELLVSDNKKVLSRQDMGGEAR